jgi:hypothetical protein
MVFSCGRQKSTGYCCANYMLLWCCVNPIKLAMHHFITFFGKSQYNIGIVFSHCTSGHAMAILPISHWRVKDLQSIFLVLSHTSGYLEQKLLSRLWKSLVFLKSNFYDIEKFQCDPFSNKKDVSQRSSCRQWGLSEMAYFIFGYFPMKLDTSVVNWTTNKWDMSKNRKQGNHSDRWCD